MSPIVFIRAYMHILKNEWKHGGFLLQIFFSFEKVASINIAPVGSVDSNHFGWD
jgi:hypothetical protein